MLISKSKIYFEYAWKYSQNSRIIHNKGLVHSRKRDKLIKWKPFIMFPKPPWKMIMTINKSTVFTHICAHIYHYNTSMKTSVICIFHKYSTHT